MPVLEGDLQLKIVQAVVICFILALPVATVEAADIWDHVEISHLLHAENVEDDLSDWVVEQRSGGRTFLKDGQLEISDSRGCTIWFKEKLEAPVLIQYEPTILSGTGPTDNVRDLNCFWMARDPEHPDDIFARSEERGGDFNQYNTLRLYYVGYGGNHNKTTRFRRYKGTGEKPLLPEHDLRDPEYMITPDQTMQIQIIVYGNRTLYLRNGEVVFDFTDDDPYTDGWFGFRTVSNHMTIDNFRVYRLRERQQELPAFPGAEGFGSTTPGGRGGKVMVVNTLADYGTGEDPIPGSLRHALETPEPRIVTFAVSGLIRLKAPLVIGSREDPELGETRSFVTIAGQSAPGGGIALVDNQLTFANVHDVIVRNLRFRNGPDDGIAFSRHTRRVIVDHCSVSWATDENVGFHGDNQDITLSHLINAECLHFGGHHKGPHSAGYLVARGANRVSIHHNYISGNGWRNPQFVGNRSGFGERNRYGTPHPAFDFRNNVIYNCGSGTRIKYGARVNMVNNLYLRGPQGQTEPPLWFFNDMNGGGAWLSGNEWAGQEPGQDQWAMASVGTSSLTEEEMAQTTQDVSRCKLADPVPAPPITTVPAAELRRSLLPRVGALPHDPVDRRLVREIQHKGGELSAKSRTHDSPIPEPAAGEPRPDNDGDGMPDAWESNHGLDPNDPADAAATMGEEGYTSVEIYLNSLLSLRPAGMVKE